jgi:hypothetical protein
LNKVIDGYITLEIDEGIAVAARTVYCLLSNMN